MKTCNLKCHWKSHNNWFVRNSHFSLLALEFSYFDKEVTKLARAWESSAQDIIQLITNKLQFQKPIYYRYKSLIFALEICQIWLLTAHTVCTSQFSCLWCLVNAKWFNIWQIAGTLHRMWNNGTFLNSFALSSSSLFMWLCIVPN